MIGLRYTDDSPLLDLITPRYGGLYKPPSTARILITFCLKSAKLSLTVRDRRVDSSVEGTPIFVATNADAKNIHPVDARKREITRRVIGERTND